MGRREKEGKDGKGEILPFLPFHIDKVSTTFRSDLKPAIYLRKVC